jgi:hypothetical protein
VNIRQVEIGLHSGAGVRRLNGAMTFVVCTAAVAIPYWVDRTLRRWYEANRLLAPLGTRMGRMLNEYRARRDSLADGAVIIAAIAEMIRVEATVPPPSRFLITRARQNADASITLNNAARAVVVRFPRALFQPVMLHA